jgi:hypothetical protein
MDNFHKECPARMEDGRFLTDYRSSNTREQYNKAVNGIVNDHEMRTFLQQNGEKIMDVEWNLFKTKNSCRTECCLHTLPTRATHGASYDELKLYNAVKTGALKKSDKRYPNCPAYNDYRMAHTDETKY